MKIEFLLGEKRMLSVSYIKLINNRFFDKVIIKIKNIKYANLQYNEIIDTDVIINIYFKGLEDKFIFNVANIFFKTQEIILIGTLDKQCSYDQGIIDNIKLLHDTKGKINWYGLKHKQKYFYLRGCCLIFGVRDKIDNLNSNIVIDLSRVEVDLDVYYEIGKSFFKSYGYFGTEINSFIDCLCSIDESMKKKEKMPILTIKGYENFKKYFFDKVLFFDLYNEFRKSGFEVINDNYNPIE